MKIWNILCHILPVSSSLQYDAPLASIFNRCFTFPLRHWPDGQTALVIGMVAGVDFGQLPLLIGLLAGFTINIGDGSFNFVVIDLFEVVDLVVDDHVVGQHVDVGIFGVGHEGAAEGVEHEFFGEDVGVLSDEVGDHADGQVGAHVHQA
jgi:hypothetical protein